MYKAVISDLDGTLLNPQHQISEFTRNTLRHLAERGVRIILASGRHLQDMRGIRESLKLDCELISANGALVTDADGQILSQATLHPQLADELLALAPQGRGAFDVNVYRADGWHIPEDRPEWARVHHESGFSYTLTPLHEMSRHDVHKIFFTGETAALDALEQSFAERYADQAYVVRTADDCLEVMAPGVNKGIAAQAMLAALGLRAEETVAFGDSMNDLELLSVVGRGVLMGNARPQLQDLLPEHPRAHPCGDDGVARHLIDLFALEV
jgi:Cof subfamily protein (haloacid dehalogenase superfamily)